ncbi:MAG: hypothetical protein HY553_03600 [Elusimicrobia bacterium]|nr:hypothetical protein [Elusimicrobiota bacterium]
MLSRKAVMAGLLWGTALCPDPRFVPPGPDERARAVGAAFDAAGFEPMRAPGPGDWLSRHYEGGQTYEEYARELEPSPERRRIYLRPLGPLPAVLEPGLLRDFAEAYFGLPVVWTGPLDGSRLGFRTRMDPDTGVQVKTGDVFAYLRRDVPADAAAVLAVTGSDLYPIATWRFVFGQAQPSFRVGVFSVKRLGAGVGARRLRERAFRTLAHETGHLLGLKHCIYFLCPMNGANHLSEADAQPLRPCPVCLRKLQRAAGFDVGVRERRLAAVLRRAGIE